MQKYKFRPTLAGTLLTLVATGLFIGLSLWQISRADEKRSLQALMDARFQQPAMPYRGGALDMDIMQYRTLVVQGRFQQEGQILLDNVIRDSKPGYEVITPFRLESGAWLLVNRGWIAQGPSREKLPQIYTPEQPLELTGRADRPRSRPVVGGDSPLQGSSDSWLYLDTDFYRQRTELTVPDFILLLDPNSPAGFDRQWPVFNAKVGMHIGYAIHWAAFALIALGTWLALSLKRREQPST